MATRTRYAPDRGLTVRMTVTMFLLGLVFVAFVAAIIGACVASHQSAAFIVGRAHRLIVVDLRDRIAFRRTVTTVLVESPQARGRAGVAR